MAAAAATTAAPLPLSFSMHAGLDAVLESAPKGYGLPPSPSPTDDERDDLVSRLDKLADRQRTPAPPSLVFERTMGDTEASYYLPSRADGVNDMYLRLGFRAPSRLFAAARVRAAWAYMRLMHPPLAAHVRMEPGVYDSARLAYVPPRSVREALVQADAALECVCARGDALVDAYLNGPRTLNDERLACLIFGCVPSGADADTELLPTPAGTPDPSGHRAEAPPASSSSSYGEASDDVREYDLLICATHFLGDGMALHRFANELFLLLAARDAEGREKTTEEIEDMLRTEWEERWGGNDREEKLARGPSVLPLAIEDAIPRVEGRFRRAAGKVDFDANQKEVIGGHAFPRRKHPVRHTVVPTVPLDVKKTKAILKKCKENGVSIANAMFALSALAWARMKESEQRNDLPILMYSALNLRPYLLASATADRSYWFTAIGYINIILPSFLPSSSANQPQNQSANEEQDQDQDKNQNQALKTQDAVRRTFWHRARECKSQISRTAKHPLLMSRTHEMARLRGARARAWAREDDEKALGVWVAPPKVPTPTPAPSPVEEADAPWKLPPAPSTALVGLSMLGNLDAMYSHASYPALALHTLTTGSRQRAGALLLFGYTFNARLWFSLGYDENGFADGVVERWWGELLRGVDEFLLE
ncbi:hypothetical protein M0805_004120 [Coniferiporia weirii]|nr:hypothetical protein M0805_004120 [Coniferiporia weirii]